MPRRRRLKDYRRWERAQPMELWQMDVMGGVRLEDGTECKVITCGLQGNDTVFARRARDWVFGQTGNDTIVGGDDRDVLIGGAGADVLRADELKTDDDFD
jgi:Ca2+-binding RTX toxin-like protein